MRVVITLNFSYLHNRFKSSQRVTFFITELVGKGTTATGLLERSKSNTVHNFRISD